MLQRVVPGEFHRIQGPFDHLVHRGKKMIPPFNGQVSVDTTGNGAGAVHLLACRRLDDLLPVFAHQDGALAEFRIFLDHLEDVALFRRRTETEQKIGRCQVEEVQHVGLHHLAVMHQPAHLFRRRRQLIDTGDHVHGFCCGQMVADRADAAKPLHDHRHFPHQPAADEPLEAAEFDNVQPGFIHLVFRIQMDRHLAVAFHAGDGRDFNQSGFSHRHHPQSNLIISRSKPRNLPVSSLESVSKMMSPLGAQPGIW